MWLCNSCKMLFLIGCRLEYELLVFINQMIYNGGVLMEVEYDNIGYDKRTM